MYDVITSRSSFATSNTECMPSTVVPPPPPPPPPCPPPPPPPPPLTSFPASTGTSAQHVMTPSRPRSRLRKLQWTTIPAVKVIGKQNVWTEVNKKYGGIVQVPGSQQEHRQPQEDVTDENESEVDLEEIERLFSVAVAGRTAINGKHSCNVGGSQSINGGDDEQAQIDKKKSSVEQVNLLDSKRSLNVNIFLRRLQTLIQEGPNSSISMASQSPADIVLRALKDAASCCGNESTDNDSCDGVSARLTAETLRCLLKILPDNEESKLLSEYSGDRSRLGPAERFLIELSTLPDYRLRIDALLVKEEFNNSVDWIRPVVDAVILTAKEIKESEMLRELIYIILLVGNFLNAGGHAGDAVGFRLNSLLKLTEIRANRPNMNLMHYVALQAKTKNPSLLNLPMHFAHRQDAAMYSAETIASDVAALHEKIRSVARLLNDIDDARFKQQFNGFIEAANEELRDLDQDLAEVETQRRQLAEYFCEDCTSFKLDDCITTLNTFFDNFSKAIEENEQRRNQAVKAEERRRQREQQITARQQTTEDSGRCSQQSSIDSNDNNAQNQQSYDKLQQSWNSRFSCSEEDRTLTPSLLRHRRPSADSGTSSIATAAASNDLMDYLLRQRPDRWSLDGGSELIDTTIETSRPVTISGGSLRRRGKRRPRLLTPEMLQTEREWTGSPSTTISTTPSPLFSVSGGTNATSSLSSTPEPVQQQQQRVPRRLLPAQPEGEVWRFTSNGSSNSAGYLPSSRRCSTSIIDGGRYFVPISGAPATAFNCESPSVPYGERRVRSALARRQLPVIADLPAGPPPTDNSAPEVVPTLGSGAGKSDLRSQSVRFEGDETTYRLRDAGDVALRNGSQTSAAKPRTTLAVSTKTREEDSGSGMTERQLVRVVAADRKDACLTLYMRKGQNDCNEQQQHSVGLPSATSFVGTADVCDNKTSSGRLERADNSGEAPSSTCISASAAAAAATTKNASFALSTAAAVGSEIGENIEQRTHATVDASRDSNQSSSSASSSSASARARVETMKDRFRKLSLLYQTSLQEDLQCLPPKKRSTADSQVSENTIEGVCDHVPKSSHATKSVNEQCNTSVGEMERGSFTAMETNLTEISPDNQLTFSKTASSDEFDSTSTTSAGQDEGFESESVYDNNYSSRPRPSTAPTSPAAGRCLTLNSNRIRQDLISDTTVEKITFTENGEQAEFNNNFINDSSQSTFNGRRCCETLPSENDDDDSDFKQVIKEITDYCEQYVNSNADDSYSSPTSSTYKNDNRTASQASKQLTVSTSSKALSTKPRNQALTPSLARKTTATASASSVTSSVANRRSHTSPSSVTSRTSVSTGSGCFSRSSSADRSFQRGTVARSTFPSTLTTGRGSSADSRLQSRDQLRGGNAAAAKSQANSVFARNSVQKATIVKNDRTVNGAVRSTTPMNDSAATRSQRPINTRGNSAASVTQQPIKPRATSTDGSLPSLSHVDRHAGQSSSSTSSRVFSTPVRYGVTLNTTSSSSKTQSQTANEQKTLLTDRSLDRNNGAAASLASKVVNSKPTVTATVNRSRTGSESSSVDFSPKSMPSVFSRLTDRSHYAKNPIKTDSAAGGSPAIDIHGGSVRSTETHNGTDVRGIPKSAAPRQWPLSPAAGSRRLQTTSTSTALARK